MVLIISSKIDVLSLLTGAEAAQEALGEAVVADGRAAAVEADHVVMAGTGTLI